MFGLSTKKLQPISGGLVLLQLRTKQKNEFSELSILVEGIMWNNSVKLFWICTSGSGDVFYKISYLGLWWPSCSAEQNHLCTFGRWHYGTHSCEIILNLGQRFRRCRLKKGLTQDEPITIKAEEAALQARKELSDDETHLIIIFQSHIWYFNLVL